MFPSSNSGRSMAVLWEVASVREVSGGGFFSDAVPSQGRWCSPSCRFRAHDLVSFHGFSRPWCLWNHFQLPQSQKKLVPKCSKPIPFFGMIWWPAPQQRWRHGRCHNLATGSLASLSSDDTSSKAPQSFSGSAHHDQRLGELGPENGEKTMAYRHTTGRHTMTCYGYSPMDFVWFGKTWWNPMFKPRCSDEKRYHWSRGSFAAPFGSPAAAMSSAGISAAARSVVFTICLLILVPTSSGWWFGTWLLCSPIVGMMIQSDELIFFQRGSWNHQPVINLKQENRF